MRKDEERQKPKLGSVGKIQKELYAKKTRIKPYVRRGFSENLDLEVDNDWKNEETGKDLELLEKQKTREPMTVFTKVLILSMMFFAFSVVGAFLVFFYGQNEVNYEAARVTVLGPNSVAGGEELSFDVTVINDNPVDMILTDIIVNYPKGTITADAEGLPLPKDIRSIEEIRPGLEETGKFKAILFGKEGDTKDIGIVFQYRVPGSDNIFFKERVYTVQIDSAPVIVNATHEELLQTGSNVEITIDVASNAAKRVRNLLLVVDYPFGFEFASSSVPTFDGDGTFDIGDLRPGEEREIKISGTVSGQDDELRTFRYSIGAQSAERKNEIGSLFTFTESQIKIQRPPVTMKLVLNEESGILQTTESGTQMDFTLNYTNNLNSKIVDASIVVELSGQGYDRRKVFSERGFYRSVTDSITWSKSEQSELGMIEVGESGSVNFAIDTLTAREMAGLLQNPEIRLVVRFEGTNFEDGNSAERKIESTTTKRVKIVTDITMDNTLLYSVGPIENTGPIQPTVGSLTTYTAHWKLRNTTNEVKDVEVRATIPRYVSFRDVLVPENASVSFNERTREVIWKAGVIEPGAGYTRAAKEVYFGLTFEPSLDQVDFTPTIINTPTITAFDTFTELPVTAESIDATSRLSQDPDYDSRQATVTE